MAFMLDEWHVHSYTIIPSPPYCKQNDLLYNVWDLLAYIDYPN